MTQSPQTWAIVLAAGRGKRLSKLTADDRGVAVPKQFCSLRGGASLLRAALRRAAAIAPPARICTVVAEEHRRWWRRELRDLPSSNIIVQPANRGTANGILLPLLHVLRRDPHASVVLLPSDHHVQDETILADALHEALQQIVMHPEAILLLGIEPDEVDPDLGYILPETAPSNGLSGIDGLRGVARFVEKPPASLARDLISAGALWNAFIVAAHGGSLLDLFEAQYPVVVAGMRSALQRDRYSPQRAPALGEFYAHLQEIDFSRRVLPGAERLLQVLRVPVCGWSDLGTPRRLAATLQRVPPSMSVPLDLRDGALAGVLSLAAQHERLGARGGRPLVLQ